MRYFTRPRAYWRDNDDPLLPHLSVSDHRPVDTGLCDHRGDPIWRAPERVGFHKPKVLVAARLSASLDDRLASPTQSQQRSQPRDTALIPQLRQ